MSAVPMVPPTVYVALSKRLVNVADVYVEPDRRLYAVYLDRVCHVHRQ